MQARETQQREPAAHFEVVGEEIGVLEDRVLSVECVLGAGAARHTRDAHHSKVVLPRMAWGGGGRGEGAAGVGRGWHALLCIRMVGEAAGAGMAPLAAAGGTRACACHPQTPSPAHRPAAQIAEVHQRLCLPAAARRAARLCHQRCILGLCLFLCLVNIATGPSSLAALAALALAASALAIAGWGLGRWGQRGYLKFQPVAWCRGRGGAAAGARQFLQPETRPHTSLGTHITHRIRSTATAAAKATNSAPIRPSQQRRCPATEHRAGGRRSRFHGQLSSSPTLSPIQDHFCSL